MKEERPLLIWRRTQENRYSLPALLGGLEERGWSQKLRIFLGNSLAEIKEKISPRMTLIAYSFMTPHLLKVKEEVEELRKKFKEEILLLAGGPHATADPRGTLKLGFNYVFQGEAEETLPQFLDQYLTGKIPAANIISSKDKPPPSFFPPPYSLEHRFFGPMEISRGCLYACTFCQTPRLFGHNLRHRNLESIFYHLRKAASFGYGRCSFISANALAYGAKDASAANLLALTELFKVCQEAGYRKINFGSFPTEVRPDWVSREALALIKKFCSNRTIVLGVQSGSDDLLQKLHRHHTAEQALQAVRLVAAAGFTSHVDFMFGLPEETKEDRLRSLQLAAQMIEKYGAKIHAHTFLPLPGTPLFKKDPTPLDEETKNTLTSWERKKKLDGWWKEQEILAREILKWRDQGLISRI